MSRLLTVLRTAAVTALGLSVLSVAPQASAGLPAGPAVGDCHRITYADGLEPHETKPPVSCSSRHTSVTIAVVSVPEDIDWDSADVYKKMVVPCYRALDATLGRTARARALSAYSWVWFMPTPQERADGARWVRCDAVLPAGKSFRPIPDTSPLLESPQTDQVRRCLTAKPYYLTQCASRHSYRVTGLVLMRFDSYPKFRQTRRLALAKCPSRVSSRYYRFDYPDRFEWRAGHRFIECYTKTHS